MMTRTEYMTMARRATEQYEHFLYTFPRGTNIVFVVSRDVFSAMINYDATNIQVNFATDAYATYQGVPVCCINEESDIFFMPVVYSQHFQHHDGIQVGDFVLFNDEDDDLLYRLVRLTPEAMYADTGLTVSFIDDRTPMRNHADAVAAAATNATVETNFATDVTTATADTIAYHPDYLTYAGIPAVVYDAATTAGIVDDLTATGTIGRFEPAATFAGETIHIDERIFEQLTGWEPQYTAQWQTERPVRAKRKAVVEEKELNPGDTELIDEYLSSFLRNGA